MYCELLSGEAERGREDMNDSIQFWRGVATADPADAVAEANVAFGLFWLSTADPANAHALLTEALAIAEKMQREGTARNQPDGMAERFPHRACQASVKLRRVSLRPDSAPPVGSTRPYAGIIAK